MLAILTFYLDMASQTTQQVDYRFGSGSGASIAQILTNTEQRQERFVATLEVTPRRTPVQDQLFYG
jgi:hypothetical protein